MSQQAVIYTYIMHSKLCALNCASHVAALQGNVIYLSSQKHRTIQNRLILVAVIIFEVLLLIGLKYFSQIMSQQAGFANEGKDFKFLNRIINLNEFIYIKCRS